MANTKISQLPSYTGTAADLRWFVMNNSGETSTFKYSGYSTSLTFGSGTDSIKSTNATTASGTDSIAIGKNANASGNPAIAIGKNTIASAGISIGENNNTNSQVSTALGVNNNVTGNGTLAVGDGCSATNYFAIALGTNSSCSGYYGMSQGRYANGGGTGTIQLGNNNMNTFGENSIAIAAWNEMSAVPFNIGNNSTWLANNLEPSTQSIVSGLDRIVMISSPKSGVKQNNKGVTLINASGSTFDANIIGSTIIGLSGFTGTRDNTFYSKNISDQGTFSTKVQPISSGTTFTCNLENGGKSQFYITGTSTINITNVRDGASFMIKTQTDGNYVMTWTATGGYTFVFEGGIKDPGNNVTDIFVFEVFGSVIYGNRRHNYS